MPWQKSFDPADKLEAAMRVFWARGYEATSVQDLVDATGVQRGSLYATWGDKRGLFLAALGMYDDMVRKQRLEALERMNSPLEALRALLFGVAERTGGKNNAPSGCFLTNTALELADRDPETRQVVAASQADVEAFFLRQIQKAQAAGEADPALDSTDVARGLLATLLGLLVLSRSRPEPALLNGIARDALRRLGPAASDQPITLYRKGDLP